MARLFLLIIILGTFISISSFFGGISATFNGYGKVAHILIYSSLAGTILLPIMGIIALFFPRPARKPDDNLPVNIWRRLAALYIDFTVVMSISMPPIALTMLE